MSLGVSTGAKIWNRLGKTEKNAISAKSVLVTSDLQKESMRLKNEFETYAETGPLFSRHSCIPINKSLLFKDLNDESDESLANAWKRERIPDYVKSLDVTQERATDPPSVSDYILGIMDSRCKFFSVTGNYKF